VIQEVREKVRGFNKSSVQSKYASGVNFAPCHTQNPLPRSVDGSPSTFVAASLKGRGFHLGASVVVSFVFEQVGLHHPSAFVKQSYLKIEIVLFVT